MVPSVVSSVACRISGTEVSGQVDENDARVGSREGENQSLGLVVWQGDQYSANFVQPSSPLLNRAESACGKTGKIRQHFFDCVPGMRVSRCPPQIETWVHRKIAEEFRADVARRSKHTDADSR